MNELRERLREEFRDKEYADAYLDDFLNAWIATQLKVIREQRGFKQEDLAELAGMKQERISVLENVNYGAWSIKTLRRLASALDVALHVSFETVGSRIDSVVSFSRKSLERVGRIESLKVAAAPEIKIEVQRPTQRPEPPVAYGGGKPFGWFRIAPLRKPLPRYYGGGPAIPHLGAPERSIAYTVRPHWAGGGPAETYFVGQVQPESVPVPEAFEGTPTQASPLLDAMRPSQPQ